MTNELLKLLRYQRLDARNSGEEAKYALMREAADEIERLQSMVDSQARMIAWLDPPDSPAAEPVAAPKCSCKFESTPNSMSVTTDPNCPLHARYLWQNEAPEKSDGPAPLVGALQDKVHEDTGAVRVGRSVKAAVEPDERHCIDQLEPRFECHVCGRKYRTAEVRDHHQEECKDAAESWRSLKSEEQQPDKWAALRGDQWTPAEMSRLRQRNRAPAEHEWDADGKCKWCPAERT